MPSLVLDVYVPIKSVRSRDPWPYALSRSATAPIVARPPACKNRRRESFCLIKRKDSSDRDMKHQWAILLDEFEAKSKRRKLVCRIMLASSCIPSRYECERSCDA